KLKDRLAEHPEWMEFESTCSHWPAMDGSANVEDYVLDQPNGPYRAVGLRVYDPKTRQWAIWWLDGRYPAGPIDPPVSGHFENGIGRFYSDYTQDGKPMRVRYMWSHITPTSARWEQASTADAGKTWKTDWIMEFQRAPNSSREPSDAARVAAAATGAHGFDF